MNKKLQRKLERYNKGQTAAILINMVRKGANRICGYKKFEYIDIKDIKEDGTVKIGKKRCKN